MTVPDWDDDYIDACLRQGQKPATAAHTYDPDRDCRWCRHPVHGITCSWAFNCRCESSFSSRDDSWRPNWLGYGATPYLFADTTGVDGWVAQLATNFTTRGQHVKFLLLNPQVNERSST